MPIFQDEEDLAGYPQITKTTQRPHSNPQREDSSIRKACEENISGSSLSNSPENKPSLLAMQWSETSDRSELMERLKRGESPTWIPNRSIEWLFQDNNICTDPRTEALSSPLLPSPEFRKSSHTSITETAENNQIERPRSALHSGDFTQKGEIVEDEKESIDTSYVPTPWLATTPPRNFTPFQLDPRFPRVSRGPSLSPSLSSFMLMAPTSPLVQSESNEDLNVDILDIGAGLHKTARRHTLQASHSSNSPLPQSSLAALNSSRPLPNLRRNNALPYQAHQPRRSLSSFPDDPILNSPPFMRQRRPSYTSESSPLHLASMVGSYEESILRGRMSTNPSKPLDFVAKIGVLGRGKCKAYLRCPAHVTLPFPAVFYSYGTTSHDRMAKSEDGPSPYVGQIDLENGIKPKEKKRRKITKAENQGPNDRETLEASLPGDNEKEDCKKSRLPASEEENAPASPRAPPGGSYRIPEKGQIQIIIKNPNNTAIKLFLVPYDLAGMTSGTKTFLRQRIYSAAPIIDGPLPASPIPSKILRYLIHLHICCPSKNRFYLYKTIRVVFANRVPDGKESLRSEIQLPEPRFSPWKPTRESIGTVSSGPGVGAGAILVADKAFRRRSSGFPLANLTNAGVFRYPGLDSSSNVVDERELLSVGLSSEHITPPLRPYASGGSLNSEEVPTFPLPSSLLGFKQRSIDSIPTSSNSQISSNQSASQGSSSKSTAWHNKEDFEPKEIPVYDKLRKGDAGYGGYAYQQSTPEGLLAKRLKNLDITSGIAMSSRFHENQSWAETNGIEDD